MAKPFTAEPEFDPRRNAFNWGFWAGFHNRVPAPAPTDKDWVAGMSAGASYRASPPPGWDRTTSEPAWASYRKKP
jgi:hypothetical protein